MNKRPDRVILSPGGSFDYNSVKHWEKSLNLFFAIAVMFAAMFFCCTVRADSAAEAQLEILTQRKSSLESEMETTQREFNRAQKQYTDALKQGNSTEISRANDEWTSWYNKQVEIQAQIKSVERQSADLLGSGRLPAPPVNTPVTPSMAFGTDQGRYTSTSEPIGGRTPPAVIQLQAAQAELAGLEEFRSAESMIGRYGGSSLDNLGKAEMSSIKREMTQAASGTLPSGGAFTSTPSSGFSANPKGVTATTTASPPTISAPIGVSAPVTVSTSATVIASPSTPPTPVYSSRLEAETAAAKKFEPEPTGRETGSSVISSSFPGAAPMAMNVASLPPEFATSASTTGPRLPSDTGGLGYTDSKRAPPMTGTQKMDLERLTNRKEILLSQYEESQRKFQYNTRQMHAAARAGSTTELAKLEEDVRKYGGEYQSLLREIAVIDGKINELLEETGQLPGRQQAVGPYSDADIVEDDGSIRPGDGLQLIVTEDPDFNGIHQVKVGGYIMLPRIGRVFVRGKQPMEAEQIIKDVLEKTQLRVATVTVERISMAPRRSPDGIGIDRVGPPPPEPKLIIYLAGEFITPGPLVIPVGFKPTLMTTIIRSGGITPSGDLTRVKLLRIVEGRGAVEEINVSGILSGQIPPADIELQAGDIIVIPPFAPIVYVTGNVLKPGTLRLFQDETLTAYAAILRAGGFARFANLKKVYVVRDLGNGEKVRMPVNIREVQHGTMPDVMLQGKDIVVVPERFFSF